MGDKHAGLAEEPRKADDVGDAFLPGLLRPLLLVLLGMVYGDGSWSVPNILVLLLTIIIGANYLALLKG